MLMPSGPRALDGLLHLIASITSVVVIVMCCVLSACSCLCVCLFVLFEVCVVMLV